MADTHLDGSACAATALLAALHPTEIAVALDALSDAVRSDLAEILDLLPGAALPALRDQLARRAASLSPTEAHEVTRRIVSPLVPTLLANLNGQKGLVAAEMEAGVLALLSEWPPLLVHALLVLTWEAAGLPAATIALDLWSS
ncbi:MAG TPA: hypothetical protein VI916_14735 [Acidimicrobiia bacterium]|nr:hypothetical protein [Acidimicrobiia bacterium]